MIGTFEIPLPDGYEAAGLGRATTGMMYWNGFEWRIRQDSGQSVVQYLLARPAWSFAKWLDEQKPGTRCEVLYNGSWRLAVVIHDNLIGSTVLRLVSPISVYWSNTSTLSRDHVRNVDPPKEQTCLKQSGNG